MDKFIGKRLDGRYIIKEVIGVGGMAYVYKAYDSVDDRIVAIKILKEEFLSNEDFTRRFKNESKAIAILSHPNIVKVYDVSFGDRLQYLVMEYIDGITLKEYIEQQKVVRWKEAVHFVVQILRALQHAHDKGIVHRDIKPQNIMLLPDGTIKVTDFGIARFSRTDIRATGMTDKAIGSVHYISPEQARGDLTDEKADLYSVGVMLYEMLCGQLPFEADNAVSVAIMQLQSEPKKLREINPSVPEGLEEITVKAMQKDSEKRYQSAAEMLSDIDEFKRNPSIRFEYTYFVDPTPTRFVETVSKQRAASTADEEEEKPRRGLPVMPILAAITGAVMLVALVFVGIIFIAEVANKPGGAEDVIVPDLRGKVYEEVIVDEQYTSLFSFDYTTAYDDTVPAGKIISQSPAPNSTVKEARQTITCCISLGTKMTQIQNVDGYRQDVAKDLLTNDGFSVKVTLAASDTVPEGMVIRSNPAGGTTVANGSVVTLIVSNGANPVAEIEIPSVLSSSKDDAIQFLIGKGFTTPPKIIYKNNNSSMPQQYSAGIVIEQYPAGGSMLSLDGEITLTVSSGYTDVEQVYVELPEIEQTVDLQVFIDGVLQTGTEYTFRGIMPSVKRYIYLNFYEKTASYRVDVKIAYTGSASSAFELYRTYSMNGITGESTLIDSRIFPSASTDPAPEDPGTEPEDPGTEPENPGEEPQI